MSVGVMAASFAVILPIPGGGPSKAGAAVTPLPTSGKDGGGRVTGAGPKVPSSSTFGILPNIVEQGGCQSWGIRYPATTLANANVRGTWSVNASGGVFAEPTGGSGLPFHGSLNSVNECPTQPVVGIAATSDSSGYWVATAHGSVYSFTAPFGGSRSTGKFTGSMVSIVADPGSSTGYWLVSQLGQVYAYGGAPYLGGSPATLFPAHNVYGESVAAMAATPSGGGYWMVTNYGTVYAYGNAQMAGFNDPGLDGTNFDWYAGIGSGPGGDGFWLVRSRGQTYAFGETYFGNPTIPSQNEVVALATTTQHTGYDLMDTSGQFYAYGTVPFTGNNPYATPPPPPPPPPPAGSPPEQTEGTGNTVTNATPPCGGDPVNCESGDLWQTRTDVTVPELGFNFALTRTYNSNAATTLGAFGYGWSSSATMSLAVTPTKSAMVTEADGSTVTFYTSTTSIFVAPKGTMATLTRASTGGYVFTVRKDMTYTFNAYGRLISESNHDGDSLIFTYKALKNGTTVTTGRLAKITDPFGRTIVFSYNATSLVNSITNPLGGVTTYQYHTRNLTSVTDPEGRSTKYGYSSTHRMVTETSPTGGITTTTYNASGKVVEQTSPSGTIRWSYVGTNATAGSTTITGPTGSVTKETFTHGQMIARTKAYGTPDAATWKYTYTATTFGQTSVTDPRGGVTKTTYNTTGDVTSETNALGHIVTTTPLYNSFNEPSARRATTGRVTWFFYDSYGNLTKMETYPTSTAACVLTPTTSHCKAVGRTTTYSVCEAATCGSSLFSYIRGEVEASTDPAGDSRVYVYNTYGQVGLMFVHPTSGTTDGVQVGAYDSLGEKVCQGSAADTSQKIYCDGSTRVPGTTSWTYNADGQVLTYTNGLTKTTTDAYDIPEGTGLCTASITGAAYCDTVVDPTGNTTVTYYDQTGRKVGVVTGAGTPSASTTATAYQVELGSGPCTLGVATATNCEVTTNGNGQTTTKYLNALTQVIETISPGGHVTDSTYDGTGNVVTTATASGITTNTYNLGNELTSVTYSGRATGFSAASDVTYTYNTAGQVTKTTDGTGTTTNVYNTADLLASTTDGGGKTVSYGYNFDNQVTTLTYTDGRVVHRAYNGMGQMIATSDLQGRVTSFGYVLSAPGVPGGSEMTTSTPNGETQTKTVNAAGEQVATSLSPNTPPLTSPSMNLVDTYSANGLLAGQSESVGGAVVTQSSYGYNAKDQVTTTSASGAGAPGATGTYGYDGAGNPTAMVSPTTGAPVTQTFNSAGELETASTSSGSTTSFGYDGAGNRISETVSGGTTTSYAYNQADELTAVTTPAGQSSFTYNGDGLRMSETTGGATSQFTWNTQGSTPELLSNGSTYFIYGPTGQVVEQENTTATGKNPVYLVHDPVGSTVAMTNSTRAVSTYTYNAYGAVVAHSGPDTTPIAFAGGYTDAVSGLIYLVHRYYTPGTGQFLSVDPLVATTGQPYQYANGDPVNNTDPSGKDPTCSGPGDTTFIRRYPQMERSNDPVTVGGGYITSSLTCRGYWHITHGENGNHVLQSLLTWTKFTGAIETTLNAPTHIEYQSASNQNTDRYLYDAYVTILTYTNDSTWTATFFVVRLRFTNRRVITAWAKHPRWSRTATLLGTTCGADPSTVESIV
ncbi:MAG: RHS repeat-associated core domain-containing protein [Acidimicrobiales bacterium]